MAHRRGARSSPARMVGLLFNRAWMPARLADLVTHICRLVRSVIAGRLATDKSPARCYPLRHLDRSKSE